MRLCLKKMKYFTGYVLPLLVTVSPIILSKAGQTRDLKIATGLDIGYEFYERKYDSEYGGELTNQSAVVTMTEDLTLSSDDRYSRFRISPMIDIDSITARDAARFQYTPGFRYDIDTYDHDIDHKLRASFSRYLTQNWHLSLTEHFVLSDIVEDSSTDGTTDVSELSDNDGRRLYLTNDLSVSTSYTYWEDSSLTFTYTFALLEDVDDDEFSNGYNDYDRHTFLFSAGHRFDSRWRLSFSTGYVRGLYYDNDLQTTEQEQSITTNDLEEFRIASTLYANLIEYHPLSLTYNFYGVDYDDPVRRSNAINNLTLGWQWNFSKDVTLSLGGGPSYTKTDGQDGDLGYNANLGIRYNFKNGNIRLSGIRGYDRQNFSGTDENGLQEYWQTRVDVRYRVWENVSFSTYASYRYEDQEDITGADFTAGDENYPEYQFSFFNREISRAGASLSYYFRQWYNLSISYNFTHQNSERSDDSYEEHRFLIALNFEKDLFKW